MSGRDSSATVKIGDTVIRWPVSLGDTAHEKAKPMKGVVVYIHPKGRFHVVEFDQGIRESFLGIAQ